jgi:hypothetical protein
LNAAVTVPALPSVTATSLMNNEGAASSSVIVPTPVPSAIVAFVGTDKTTLNVSLDSLSVSPLTVIETFCVVTPAAKVNVPLPAV